MLKAISYGGYYSTGGSIVRDIFREFEPAFEFSIEFRLLKERFGLFDLENALLTSYAPENIDLAIRDFVWLTSNLARKSGRFRKAGMSYDAKSGNIFSNATRNFLEDISDYSYPMDWHFFDFQKSYLSQIAGRFEKKLLTKDIRQKEGRKLATLAYPEADKYFRAARNYINAILDGVRQVNGRGENSVVGLHNAIPPFSTELIDKGINYFESCKVIITDRDPRDVFVNYPKDSYGRYLPKSADLLEKARGFVHFYRSIRKNQRAVAQHPNVLFLRFEDVCNNYSEFLEKILDFSELEKSEHKNKGAFFSSEASLKNVGMWRNSTGDMAKAVSFIEEELGDFLYPL